MKPKLKPAKKGTIKSYFQSLNSLEKSPGCSKSLAHHPSKMSAAPSCPAIKPENEPHETHSFLWIGSDKIPTNWTCNKAGTIEDSLKRSAAFRKEAEKNKTKELVLQREGKAISPHFPCCLIKDERLTVRYIKASGQLKQTDENHASAIHKRKCLTGNPVIFHVLTKGGENTKKIMKNKEFPKKFQEVTVYAYEGEKVRHVLKRDGRFLKTVFQQNCALLEKGTDIKTEMIDSVDELDGKTVKIIKIDKNSPPQSLEDAYVMEGESQRSDSDENQDHQQQSTTAETVNSGAKKEKPKQFVTFQPEIIPNSENVKKHLSSQIKNMIKRMKTERDMKNFFHVEYGKNSQTCREVKTVKTLMELSNSVCQVRINGNPGGTGFLLFDKFVLTNGHVIKNIYDMSTGQLSEEVTVHFSFESLNQVETGAKVEEVVGFEYWSDPSGHKYDWALLRVSADQELPRPLLNHFGFLPKSGAICIIGHPDGGVKKLDPCWIIPTDERSKVLGKHSQKNPEGILVECNNIIQLVTTQYFEGMMQSLQHEGHILTYGSCFAHGSSGSPVFDEHCNVVAMHSAGYEYGKISGEKKRVIEFGYPLSSILEHMLIQIVEMGRLDVLKAFLATNCTQHPKIQANVKKLVESRIPVVFRNAVNNSLHADDEILKGFFEFFTMKEQPVPMDTD
ncbi:serine protease FAM111A-like isoform X2 [Halichoeres trimaculatus]|uniref:serine protease FAM111A-like isoform X2 n=1 Tax=Halichoeres trimaculatus TaxID=147232 RepID=UPI003D9E517D